MSKKINIDYLPTVICNNNQINVIYETILIIDHFFLINENVIRKK